MPRLRAFRLLSFISSLFIGLSGFAQAPAPAVAEYVVKYKQVALQQSLRHGIPASVILAQGIFESNCGQSVLAKRSNNHFGIKCHTTWHGDTVVKSDDVANECFRKYSKVEQSYADHSLFLRTRIRYLHLFELPLTDYAGWCRGLKEAGYATYPTYAEELIRIIETNGLAALDAPAVMPSRNVMARSEPQLLRSRLNPLNGELVRLAETDLLFGREEDFVLRSLVMVSEDLSTRRIMARK